MSSDRAEGPVGSWRRISCLAVRDHPSSVGVDRDDDTIVELRGCSTGPDHCWDTELPTDEGSMTVCVAVVGDDAGVDLVEGREMVDHRRPPQGVVVPGSLLDDVGRGSDGLAAEGGDESPGEAAERA